MDSHPQTQVTIPDNTPVSRKQEEKSWCNVIYDVVAFFAKCIATLAVGSCVTAIVTAISMFFRIVIAVTSLPLLMVSFLVMRLLQFLKYGDDYDRIVHLKLSIRLWIYSGMSSFVILLAIFYGIVKNNQNLKHVVFRGATLPSWVVIYFVIFGICSLNWVITALTYKFIPKIPLNHSESGLTVPENVLEIIDCLIFRLTLSEILKRVPDLKHDKILGLYTYKWIEVATLVLIAYNAIVFFTRLVVLLYISIVGRLKSRSNNKRSQRDLFVEKVVQLRYVSYCSNGIKQSIDFILVSLMLLLTWVLYFGSHLNNETPRSKKVSEMVTLTLVSLLVCSFLWLIKSCLLLAWEVRVVYNKLESRIVEEAKKLYFLGIMGRHTHDFLHLRYDSTTNAETGVLMRIIFKFFPIGIDPRYHSSRTDAVDWWIEGETSGSDEGTNKGSDSSVGETRKQLSSKRKKLVNEALSLKEYPSRSLYDIQQAAHHFLQAREALTTEGYTSDILRKFESLIPSSEQHDSDHNGIIIASQLRRLLQAHEETEEDRDWKFFKDQMLGDIPTPTPGIPREILSTWLERAHDECLFLANTLAGANEAVTCLNNIMIWLTIAATFMLWLILTGFATTQVVVLIASPLLAATFIFGDTCKKLFQGIVFAYLVHPFDVGDLCVIEGNKMEVRRIGVWITTFSKIDTQEEVVCPNLELFTKTIINLKSNYDWNDHVEHEFSLSLGDKEIKHLKKEIEKFFNDRKDMFTASRVEVLRSGNNIKIDAKFRHVVDMKNSTYFRRNNEKYKRHLAVVEYLQRKAKTSTFAFQLSRS